MISRRFRPVLGTVAAAILMVAPGFSAEPPIAPEKLQALEKQADTPAEHARIAKEYRLRAESFEEKAAKHEANVRQSTKAMGAMAHKWPGLVTGSVHKEKELALEARRAARESRELAERHLDLSVEALASAEDRNQRPVNR